jgi:hypothetical protein
MTPPRNPLLAEIARRPTMRPHVVADPGPVLVYCDEDGLHRALVLDRLDLAHLALSIAEVQAADARAKRDELAAES